MSDALFVWNEAMGKAAAKCGVVWLHGHAAFYPFKGEDGETLARVFATEAIETR